jgi:hypothetical protein
MPVDPTQLDVATQTVRIAKKVIDLEAGVQRVTNAISNDMTQLARSVQDLSAKMADVQTRLAGVEKSLVAALRGLDVGYAPGQVSPSVPGYARDVGVPTNVIRPQDIELVGRAGATNTQANPLSTGAPPKVQSFQGTESLWYDGMEEEQDAELS